MEKIKITQIKSGIDRSERQKNTLKALGLNQAECFKRSRSYSANFRNDYQSESFGNS